MLQIQVMMPGVDFNFDSTSSTTSPFVSAPSTPHRFDNFFYSAPTSPTTPSETPFNWEETPGVAKTILTQCTDDDDDDHNEDNTSTNQVEDDDGATIYTELDDYDFQFDFSGQLETQSLTADELFDDGKIKPLKPPPRLFYGTDGGYSNSPKHSPHRSPKRVFKEANLSFKEALSPKHRRKDFDPFSEAIKQTQQRSDHDLSSELRGRERISTNSTPVRHKATRSLSPYRVSDMLLDGELNSQQNSKDSSSTWLKLRDLLLFRSASEGSAATRKHSLMKKYAVLNGKNYMSEDVKNSSFRSTDSSSGSVGSTSRRRRRVSAHEMHYTANRAVTEEMRRKTFLPYRRGLLGCLGFTTHVQGVHHEISRGFSSIFRRE